MKTQTLLFVLLFTISSNFLFSQSFINKMGNCDTSDIRLHYENIAFIASLPEDSLKYTHIYSFYCNTSVQDLADVNLQKELYNPFYSLQYNSNNYSINSVIAHLIYHKRNSLNMANLFITELKLNNNHIPIAYVYGSDNVVSNPEGFRTTLGYLVSMDSLDNFASGYTSQELNFVQIYKQTGSYFFEIRDKDRNNLLVGFKYFSPSTQSEFVKFIIANN